MDRTLQDGTPQDGTQPAGAGDELAGLDATAQAALVRAGEVRPDELVEAALARIEHLNPSLNAVVSTIDPRPAADGPFRGVPFLVKDLLLEVAGTRLTCGSRWLRDHVCSQDQELAVRYRRAGLVLVGRTNTCEMGMSPTCEPALFGPTRNPWAPERSPGGSSGGSAAAVAVGLTPMAHGNDLGGSLRYPAAWCGVFGFKPTRGRVPLGPRYGDVVSGMVAEHVLTRSVRDSAALLDAVAGPSLGDPYWVAPPARPFAAGLHEPPGRLRVALSTTPRSGREVDPAWRAAAETVARLLESQGHHVEEGSPDGLDDPDYGTALTTVFRAAAAWMIESWSRHVGRSPAEDELEPQTRAYWDEAMRVSAGDYLVAVETLQRVARRTALWFDRYDVWLTPTLGSPAPLLGALVGTDDDPLAGARRAGDSLMFDAELANVTGNPAMSVPAGFDSEGRPVAVHVLGRFGDDATLFRLAAQLEQAAPWTHRMPMQHRLVYPAGRKAPGRG